MTDFMWTLPGWKAFVKITAAGVFKTAVKMKIFKVLKAEDMMSRQAAAIRCRLSKKWTGMRSFTDLGTRPDF